MFPIILFSEQQKLWLSQLQSAQISLLSRLVLDQSTVSVWLLSSVLRSYNVSLRRCTPPHTHTFFSDPTVHHVTALPSHSRPFSCLCLYLTASLRDSPGSHFLSLVNRCLALRRRHVIGCLTRLTLAAHILPHGTIKGKTDFRLRPKFIDWNNCIPKTLRHFSPWRFSNPQW